MLAAIIVLVCLSIIIVLLENILTPDSVRGRRLPVVSEASVVSRNTSTAAPLPEPCWRHESVTVVQPCRLCSDFERASSVIPECANSFYVEEIRCEKSGKAYRSCDQAERRAQRRFWLFELLTVLVALFSGSLVVVRQRQLERSVLRKIQRQLASEV